MLLAFSETKAKQLGGAAVGGWRLTPLPAAHPPATHHAHPRAVVLIWDPVFDHVRFFRAGMHLSDELLFNLFDFAERGLPRGPSAEAPARPPPPHPSRRPASSLPPSPPPPPQLSIPRAAPFRPPDTQDLASPESRRVLAVARVSWLGLAPAPARQRLSALLLAARGSGGRLMAEVFAETARRAGLSPRSSPHLLPFFLHFSAAHPPSPPLTSPHRPAQTHNPHNPPPTPSRRSERGLSRGGAWAVFLEALKESFQRYLDDDCSGDALGELRGAARRLAEALAAARGGGCAAGFACAGGMDGYLAAVSARVRACPLTEPHGWPRLFCSVLLQGGQRGGGAGEGGPRRGPLGAGRQRRRRRARAVPPGGPRAVRRPPRPGGPLPPVRSPGGPPNVSRPHPPLPSCPGCALLRERGNAPGPAWAELSLRVRPCPGGAGRRSWRRRPRTGRRTRSGSR